MEFFYKDLEEKKKQRAKLKLISSY